MVEIATVRLMGFRNPLHDLSQLDGLLPTSRLSGFIQAGQIAANSIGANEIQAGAIDGDLITGAILKTRGTADVNGYAALEAVNDAGAAVAGALNFYQQGAVLGAGAPSGLSGGFDEIRMDHRNGGAGIVANRLGDVGIYGADLSVPQLFGSAASFTSNVGAQDFLAAGAYRLNGANGAIIYVPGNRAIFWAPAGNGDARITESSNSIFTPIRASAFTVSSSRRVKKQLRPKLHSLDTIRKLKVHDYQYRKNVQDTALLEGWQTGLIAEEAYEHVPYVVSVGEDGVPDGIDYGRLTPLLIQAVQELAERVEVLEQQLAAAGGP